MKHLQWGKSGDRKDSDIGLDSGCLLAVEPIGFPHEVYEQNETRRGAKDDSRVFGLSNWVEGEIPKVRQETPCNY